MDRESALLARWETEEPMYAAWGDFVRDEVSAAIASRDESEEHEFFKMPPSARTKRSRSLLDKAFYRKKEYANPYDDIEDKVGVRFVVLFLSDLRVVGDVIESSSSWTYEKSRDFEAERLLRPYEFDYQSLHYVVRARGTQAYGAVSINERTPCEIQVRTLLQHAYSELTHDTIYKPRVSAEPAVKRAAAKSMALIEATGDYFDEVRVKLALAAEPLDRAAALAADVYRDVIDVNSEPSSLNVMLVDHYRSWTTDELEKSLREFLKERPWLLVRITNRAEGQALYRQPAILLVYLSVQKAPAASRKNSPLSDDELRPIYSDLGKPLEA